MLKKTSQNILVDAGYTGENFATQIKDTIGATVEVKRITQVCRIAKKMGCFLLGWRSVDGYGKIASENSTPAGNVKYSGPVRQLIYTTNPIEGLHRQIRKFTKTKGAFTNTNALYKQVYCAIKKVEQKWLCLIGL